MQKLAYLQTSWSALLKHANIHNHYTKNMPAANWFYDSPLNSPNIGSQSYNILQAFNKLYWSSFVLFTNVSNFNL